MPAKNISNYLKIQLKTMAKNNVEALRLSRRISGIRKLQSAEAKTSNNQSQFSNRGFLRRRSLKICAVIEAWPPLIGGGQVHVSKLSEKLIEKYDCKTDIITRSLSDDTGKKYPHIEYQFDKKMRIYRLGPKSKFENAIARIWYYIFASYKIWRLNKIYKYDLIHAHGATSGIPAKIASWLIQKPVILTVHGSPLMDSKKKSLAPKIEAKLLTKVDYDAEITVSSNFLKYKNANRNIQVIPNGVDIKEFDEIKTKKSNIFKILFVGRFDKVKGLDYLIKAVSDLKKIRSQHFKFQISPKIRSAKTGQANFKLILVGYGFEEKNLKKMVKDLKLTDLIEFKGKLIGKKLISEYKSANLFILPSLSEGQPITLLEAFAAKLPVIATDVGDNRKFIINNKNGWLIKPKNFKMIVSAILKALKSRSLEKMGKLNHQIVKKDYTWQKITKQTYEVYKTVIKGFRE